MDKPPDRGSGKPPRSTRFPPGTSGNPSGRPKSNRCDPASAFRHVSGKPVLIMENGKQRKVSTIEALFLRVRQDALNGKQHAVKHFLDLGQQFPGPPEPPRGLNEDEIKELFGSFSPETLQEFRRFWQILAVIRDRQRKQEV
jgi:hypothetical protein